MNKIEGGAPSSGRKVIDVRSLLGLPSSTANPHLWFSLKTMPALALAVAKDLGELDPAQRSHFDQRAAAFDRSLQSRPATLSQVRRRFPGAPVPTTVPVGDLLQAVGANINAPRSRRG